jgi:hypothetical protein
MGVWKFQQLCEKTGRYAPENLPELISEVYEDEGYMVPYLHVGCDFDLSFLAIDDYPHRIISGGLSEIAAA